MPVISQVCSRLGISLGVLELSSLNTKISYPEIIKEVNTKIGGRNTSLSPLM
jgi:hypothetical protein